MIQCIVDLFRWLFCRQKIAVPKAIITKVR
jgi:hypothetical protein